MDTPSAQLWLGLALAAAINGGIARHFWLRLQDQVLLGGVVLFFLVQCGWFGLYLALTGSSVIMVGPELVPNFNDSPWAVTLGQTFFPLVALACARLLTSRRNAGTMEILAQINREAVPGFGFILGLFAVGLLLYFLGTLFVRVPFLTQFIIYLHLSFFMSPVLLGLCWRRYPVPVAVFGAAILVGGAFALGAGSRALLFLPLVFFALGLWFSLGRAARLGVAAGALLLIVPVFYLSGRIESVRKDGTVEREGDVLARAGEIGRLVGAPGGGEGLRANFTRGVERMIMWGNLVALTLSPERVPYRGFDDFAEEMRFLNQSTLFQDADAYLDESLDREFGLGAARRYGFGVVVGGTVPFPVLADGWSRGGLLGVAFYAGVLCLAWGGLERLARWFFADKPHLAIALIAILLSSSYDRMSTYGFVYNLRYLAMQALLWGGLFYVASRTFLTAKLAIPGAQPPWGRRN